MGRKEGAITGNKIIDILDKTRKEFKYLSIVLKISYYSCPDPMACCKYTEEH